MTFPSLLPALGINPEIAKLMFGASSTIWRARLTMPSAVNLGSREFTAFVPTWMMMLLSGSFLRIGLIKSSTSVLSCCTGEWFYDNLVCFGKAPATDVLDD